MKFLHVTLILSTVLFMQSCESISGTWQMVASHCNLKGNNCKIKEKNFILHYKSNGDLYAGSMKMGTYTVKGNAFTIRDKNNKERTIFFKIKNGVMITHEKGSDTSERLVKIK